MPFGWGNKSTIILNKKAYKSNLFSFSSDICAAKKNMLEFKYKIKTKTNMENSKLTDFDVLENLEIPVEKSPEVSSIVIMEPEVTEQVEVAEIVEPAETACEVETIKKWTKETKKSILHYISFTLKYSFTCGFIFALLLVGTNFSAYFNIAKGYVFSWELQKNEAGLINSVEAGNIEAKNEKIENIILESRDTKYKERLKELEKEEEKVFHSIQKIATKAKKTDVNLDIAIAPYENRIVIPKIGKNIPLLDVKDRQVDWVVELNNIFMEELENGVVRYPGSAKPWELWNAFIFGHSSNFPWLDGDYKDVFALLHKLEAWDEVIVFYWQRKYTYRMKEKEVIRPGDVDILKRDKGISELTLMTCWPVGTTLNRMILIGELVEE